jgi:heavy metal sensor kinase
MFSEKMHNLRGSLAFRLTLWYAGIFTFSFVVTFLAFYLILSSFFQNQLDQELLEDVSELSSMLTAEGLEAVKAEIDEESESEDAEEFFLLLVNTRGEKIASTDMSSWETVAIGENRLKKIVEGTEEYSIETLTVPGKENRVRVVYGKIGQGYVAQMGLSMGAYEELMLVFQTIFGFTLIVLVAVGPLFGWFMARCALSGVEEVTKAAQDISEGDLERRVVVKGRGDEIERLALTFNSMLDRIRALIKGMREMSDNIAHDLRSPITRIRGLAETTLLGGESQNNFKDMAASTVEECDFLLKIIDTMLDISEAEAGAMNLKFTDVDVSDLVRDACDLFQPVSEDKNLTVKTHTPGDISFRGDLQLLQRLVANLLDNALKYTPSGGSVTISIDGNEKNLHLAFHDTGIGIAEEDLPRIFDRFYRCDDGRSEAGAGLGLSLALAIARVHGGTITASSTPGEGSTFTVKLPRFFPPS